METIYENKKIMSKTLLYEEGGVVYYKKTSPFGKEIYQIPIEQLGKSILFSRTYHSLFFIPPAFLAFLSIRLIIKKWSVGDWTLFLGIIVLALICILLMYYLIVERKIGEVELCFGDLKLSLYMKKNEYLALKERIENLN